MPPVFGCWPRFELRDNLDPVLPRTSSHNNKSAATGSLGIRHYLLGGAIIVIRGIFFRVCLLALLILPAPSFAATKTLSWAGCGITKKAFMQDLAKAFETKTGIHISLSGGGATYGIRQVAAGKVDMGGSCRFRIEGDPNELQPVFKPIAWDALVVIVNRNNPVDNISFAQLRGILLGKITNWKQLGGQDAPIHLLVRKGKISGVGRTLRKLVLADYDADLARYAYKEYPSSGPLEQAIPKDLLALGVTGISSGRKRPVKILSLDGKQPTPENIHSGAYTLYRPLYLVYSPTDENLKLVKQFIAFAYSSEGRAIIRKNRVVPYMDALGLVMKQLEQDKRARDMGLYKATN
jgi:phosphate transport system substrate-binding protein